MPPRLPLRPARAPSVLLRQKVASEGQSICFFCSFSRSSRSTTTRQQKRQALATRRFESTLPDSGLNVKTDARKELEDALLELQKHAANYVNLSRVQLALNGLRQKPGNESIRVAILGLNDGSESEKTAKEVLKLLLADPLKSEEQWEREVDSHDLTQPLIIRVGNEEQRQPRTVSLTKGSLVHEVNVSSATLNGHNLELLLMETNPYAATHGQGFIEEFEDTVLVPTVDIPTSNNGRYTPITTPVHKALIVADGIMGGASLASLPILESEGIVAAAVNMPQYKSADTLTLPFTPVDVGIAGVGLGLIRKDIKDAMEFEHLWFESNMPKLAEWLRADVLSSSENSTKAPVRRLISSLLQNAAAAVQREEARQLSTSLGPQAFGSSTGGINSALAEWAENAHTELQEQLELAFSSRRWRKLSWWKLFWRVDDVSMLSSDIINQRLLPAAEKNAIYLAGRMEEAGTPYTEKVPIKLASKPDQDSEVITNALVLCKGSESLWPTGITATRAYLQNETIPALQALAQKLVFQTLSTSGLTTSLGALVYFGTLTTSVYEAGAVAALGIVWSMRRMQKQWETARKFWEGEVREEGRIAVRGVEMALGQALEQQRNTVDRRETDQELRKARQLVEKATEALERLK